MGASWRGMSFPRFYAAASLKREAVLRSRKPAVEFSAVLCRGLIEAGPDRTHPRHPGPAVFRGFMPRPH